MTAGSYLAALAVTLAVEAPVYAVALRSLGERGGRAWAAGLAVNATSHPLAWLAAYPVLERRLPAAAAFGAVEALVVAWEAAALTAWLRRDAVVLLAVVLVANGLSLVAGTLG